MRKFLMSIYEGALRHRVALMWSMLSTLVLGLFAHGYMLLNNALSHDSLYEFWCDESIGALKIRAGRIFVPLYEEIVGDSLTIPWLTGLISFVFIGLAVFLISRIFDVQKGWQIAIISGILTLNITVISLMESYIHDLDVDMLAMLLATLSVYLWQRYRHGWIYGIFPLAIAMGLYQSYISTAITLLLILLILDLLRGKDFKTVFGRGLSAVGMLLGAGILYIVALKITYAVTDLEMRSGGYNSMDSLAGTSLKELLHVIAYSYYRTVKAIVVPVSAFSLPINAGIHLLTIFAGGMVILQKIIDKALKWKEILLLFALILCLPFGMNISRILVNNMSHDVMHYALWLTDLLVLLLVCGKFLQNPWKIQRILRPIALCLICCSLAGNIQIANIAYYAKDAQQTWTLSFFTRLLSDMEDIEEYDREETQVVFVGNPDVLFLRKPEFSKIHNITGSEFSFVGGGSERYYVHYFDYVLNYKVKPVTEKTKKRITVKQEVVDMPVYPEKGSIKMVGDRLVVKLADYTVDTVINEEGEQEKIAVWNTEFAASARIE